MLTPRHEARTHVSSHASLDPLCDAPITLPASPHDTARRALLPFTVPTPTAAYGPPILPLRLSSLVRASSDAPAGARREPKSTHLCTKPLCASAKPHPCYGWYGRSPACLDGEPSPQSSFSTRLAPRRPRATPAGLGCRRRCRESFEISRPRRSSGPFAASPCRSEGRQSERIADGWRATSC